MGMLVGRAGTEQPHGHVRHRPPGPGPRALGNSIGPSRPVQSAPVAPTRGFQTVSLGIAQDRLRTQPYACSTRSHVAWFGLR